MKAEHGSMPLMGANANSVPVVKNVRGSAMRQVIAALIANIGTINTGMAFGFSAVVLPQLQSPNSTIPVDADQASWIASLSSMTTPVGCIFSGYLMDLIGRRLALILTEVPLIVGWLLIAFANSVPMIYGGRMLVGLGSGMVGAPARVYTGEVTQPHLRGMLLAISSVGVSSGVLIEYAVGALVPWPTLAGISCLIPCLALLSIFFVPESPNFLVSQNKTKEARDALKKFRGSTCDIDVELNTLINFSIKNNIQKVRGFSETIHACLQPTALKPFGILFTYFMIYQFSGVNTITFYAVEVFQSTGTELNKYLITVILGVVRLVATIISCVLLRRCGRRPLTMISGVGCGVTMLGLGTFMYYVEQCKLNNEPILYNWIPIACIFIFTITCCLGFLVVPWVMIGEIYPVQVRGIFGGLTTCSTHLFVFIVVKTYPFLYRHVEKYGAFWIYGVISSLGCFFFYNYVPETKGKTLQDIEDYFAGRSNSLSKKKPALLQIEKGNALPTKTLQR